MIQADKLYQGSGDVFKGFLGDTLIYPPSGTTNYYDEYFTMELLSGGTLFRTSSIFLYSVNGGAWEDPANSTAWYTTQPTCHYRDVQAGDIIRVKGTYSGQTGSWSTEEMMRYYENRTPIYANVWGNVMSLRLGDNFTGVTEYSGKGFYRLFDQGFNSDAINVVDASNLVLPLKIFHNTTYNETLYAYMFGGQTSLVHAPRKIDLEEIPLGSSTEGSLQCMFDGCTSLLDTPKIVATSLASALSYGYTSYESHCRDMFRNCSSLTTPPPALRPKTVRFKSYYGMFSGCTSLEYTPVIYAENATGWYGLQSMFDGCSSLESVTCMLSDFSGRDCLEDWLYGVANQGTFTKKDGVEFPSGSIPSGWTVVDA